MSINLFSPLHHLLICVAPVTLKERSFVVLIVNILWISNVLHYLVPQDTDHSNNRLHSVIRMKMILVVNIIVIFVKKSEIQNTGSTIVQTLVFLLIPIAFLGDFLVSSLGGLTHLTCTNIPSLWLTRARESIFRVIDVVVLAMTLLLNVSIVISIFIGGAFPIVMPWLFEIFPFNILSTIMTKHGTFSIQATYLTYSY
jgi:hypothetical protein